MKVRYRPSVGVVLVVLGAVCVFLGLWLFLLGGFSPSMVVGLVPILIGALYLVRPYFFVDAGMVTLPAAIGPVKRTFPFQSLRLEDGRLIAIADDGTRKKVPVARWMAHQQDWHAVTTSAQVQQG